MTTEEFIARYQRVPVEEYPNRVCDSIPQPLVSCRISTYQQAPYIKQCIEGVLMQKCDFPFEILIGDDESTDGTREICLEYAQKYPHIIRLFLHRRENINNGLTPGRFQSLYTLSKSRGKYQAICEGDDYWSDPLKLQKQLIYMESNPECSLCVHKVAVMKASTGKFIGFLGPDTVNKRFDVEDIIAGGGGFFQTNSMLYRSDRIVDLPDYYYNVPTGDYAAMIQLALTGCVYYISEVMSVYRNGVNGSWSKKMFSYPYKKLASHYKNINTMLEEVDKYTCFRHSEVIKEEIRENNFRYLIALGEFKLASKGEFVHLYRAYMSSLSFKYKVIHISRYYLPALFKILSIGKQIRDK